jgi:hypothetical protein
MKAYGRSGHNGSRIMLNTGYMWADTVEFGQYFSQKYFPIHTVQEDTWVAGVVNCGGEEKLPQPEFELRFLGLMPVARETQDISLQKFKISGFVAISVLLFPPLSGIA